MRPRYKTVKIVGADQNQAAALAAVELIKVIARVEV